MTKSNTAVKTIYYQVELTELLTTSAVRYFNTQTGGASELVTVLVSDQGASGASGVAETDSLSIGVTVVAVNNPPVIGIDVIEYQPPEDTAFTFNSNSPITITDVDIADVVNSSLLRLNWTGLVENQLNRNQLYLSATVRYGALRMGYRRGLRLVSTDKSFLVTISGRSRHDVCRLRSIYRDAALLTRYGGGERLLPPFQDVCTKSNLGSSLCPSGTEGGCLCVLAEADCAQTATGQGGIVLFLEAGGPLLDPWRLALTEAVRHSDMTCGGLPYFPAPNAFTQGQPCERDADCAALVVCTPGVTCACCANISAVCSRNADCDRFEAGSLCGCTEGGLGYCGPYCSRATGCTTALLKLTRTVVGVNCTFTAPWPLPGEEPFWFAFTEPAVRTCRSAAYTALGSGLEAYLDVISENQVGSSTVAVIGDIVDVDRAVQMMQYTTVSNYNRLYRLPPDQRDPLTFDIEADSVDNLVLTANDLGNSGGQVHDPRQVVTTVQLRVSAVNDPPVAHGPFTIAAAEDTPYVFSAESGGLYVSDPDSSDYGFDERIFTINMSSINGRLFLNEEFLSSEDVSGNRIRYKSWVGEKRQEARGLHSLGGPIFGEGCQFKTQCADGRLFTSSDTKFGFYASLLYGMVYSPPGDREEDAVGCGFCPENAGNKFLSITGTFEDVNQALSLVTYLPDPNFNTRTGTNRENIVFNVTDNGAIGNDITAPSLYNSLTIVVTVESVNDRPIIGRRITGLRNQRTYSSSAVASKLISDVQVVGINRSEFPVCSTLRPSGEEYFDRCGPQVRQYIDIDEDTPFFILPDVLWIHDVDANEALNMASPRRYCCAQNLVSGGECYCGQPCLCLSTLCQCDVPNVCSGSTQVLSSPGQVLVNMSVVNGMLSFYPPPGRSLFQMDRLEFLTVVNGKIVPCPNQISCMRNVSWIAMQTDLKSLQQGIEQMFLTYQGLPNFFGKDFITIWVSDQGFTDSCYNESLVATAILDIRVVALNNPPVVVYPSSVFSYQQGGVCYVDYMKFRLQNGLATGCANSTEYNIPPRSTGAGLQFFDVDMFATPYGNLTLMMTIGLQGPQHANAGNFFLMKILKAGDVWYEMFRNSIGLRTFVIQGTLPDLNTLMSSLRYNADHEYTGYLPVQVMINDNCNFGECDGNHTCGHLNPCGNHSLAGKHRPVTQGIEAVTLDVVVGSAQVCSQKFDCISCNQIAECGWCPGACLDVGKCMISGGSSGPKFELCPTSVDGRSWRMCVALTQDLITVIAGSIVAFVFLFIILYLLLRWIQRRHGTVFRYVRKQQHSLFLSGKKFNMLPPEEASWVQFLALLLLIAMFIISFQFEGGTRSAACHFQENYFLDQVSSVYMSVDTCSIRFVPTRNRPYPDSALPQIKIKFAYARDPLITLDTQNCGENSSFIMRNSRDDSTKYLGFFCNIEILVPDHIVMPEVTIVAEGENVTTLRAGPMDIDSPDFGMDFGPNAFKLQGNHLVARLQNISAKYFTFDVVHGQLIATDLVATTAGIFSSQDADMIIATTLRTHVQFWQKEGNFVCLTAGKGSLYVDNNCEGECKYQTARRSSSMDQEIVKSQPSAISAGSRRQSSASDGLISFVCSTLADGSGFLNCSRYSAEAERIADQCPLGAQFATRSEIPRIVGCYDLNICSLNENSQCLCRPSCDMANLNPPGTCDDFGRCCQTICAGYSKADMFPDEAQPRCGSAIDPVTMPWCNGQGMTQNYIFTSTSGQISLQVLAPGANQSESAFNGTSTSNMTTKVDIVEADKKILDELFHPYGTFFPSTDSFAFQLEGPGAVEATTGQFVWVRSVHYLTLEPWLLDVFSLGLLTFVEGISRSELKPSFCPAVVDDSSEVFNQRLIIIRQLLLNTIQSYPAGSSKPIPASSILAYRPVEGLPRKFVIDPGTNKFAVNFIGKSDDKVADFFITLALSVPAALCLIASSVLFVYGVFRIKAYREKETDREESFMNMSSAFTGSLGGSSLSENAQNELRGRTGIHSFVERFVVQSNLQLQKPMWLDFSIVLIQLILTILPIAIVYVGTSRVQTKFIQQACSLRPDYCSCISENSKVLTAAQGVNIFLYVYFFIAIWEMSVNYLAFKYSIGRVCLRLVFHISLFWVVAGSIYYSCSVVIFIFLGLILKPLSSIPYSLGLVCTVSFFFATYNKYLMFRVRVERAVRRSFDLARKQFIHGLTNATTALDADVLDNLMEFNVQQVLFSNGVSESRTLISASLLTFLLILTYGFIFIGFRTFTVQGQDIVASAINSFIVVSVYGFAFYMVALDKDISEKIAMKVKRIEKSLTEIMKFTSSQVKMATLMLNQFDQELHGFGAEDD
mmetsp:Transcript_58524/g.122278  ORF Transcript_58524/g.122278 Transcript_58524/m.122278 type:complete len:2330 (-) Transcript_58524:792-7781(-)